MLAPWNLLSWSAWLEVKNSMPDAMADHVSGVVDDAELKFIFSDFKSFIQVWLDKFKKNWLFVICFASNFTNVQDLDSKEAHSYTYMCA